ncbi:hypothetical protein NUW58_g2201 [Xylaria curta]|uniref:Uncharacterized protein n=1 Tax=Xylaria curta TaxID=42375 RepID=A0ACC1PJI7_9PEZI|nr:hypothetical protein NUW58_g2201 [Xylaria curta]
MCTLYEASAAAAMLHTQNGGKRDASQHGSESSKFKSSAATYTVDEGPPVASARRATGDGHGVGPDPVLADFAPALPRG